MSGVVTSSSTSAPIRSAQRTMAGLVTSATAQSTQLWLRELGSVLPSRDRVLALVAGSELLPADLVDAVAWRMFFAEMRAASSRYNQRIVPLAESLQRQSVDLGVETANAVLRSAGVRQPVQIEPAFLRQPVGVIGTTPLSFGMVGSGPRLELALLTAVERSAASPISPAKLKRLLQNAVLTPAMSGAMLVTGAVTSAFRAVTGQMWQEQPGVTEWIWTSRLTTNTCPACLAMHGRVFPVGTPLASHPNCLCYATPRLRGVTVKDADAWFRSLSPETQRSMLGPGRYALWKAGQLPLSQMAIPTSSTLWGPGIAVKPITKR